MAEIKVSDDNIRKQQHLISLVKATFGTTQGKSLMKYLEDSYLSVPVFNANVQGDKQATYAAYREGENSIVRKLKFLLEAD